MAHAEPERLAKAREEARLRKLGEREMRKPPSAWFSEGWSSRPFRPVDEAVGRFDVDKSTVTRWQAWTVFHERRKAAAADVPRPEGLPESHFDWTTDHIPLLIDHFLAFRTKYFKTERGEPFVTPEFQQKWAEKILTALVTGGKEMILAPVRHGKTQELNHLCICLWMLDPNIRVLWVSVTQGIAEKPVSQMRSILMDNEQLIEDYAQGDTFVPETRSPYRWTNEEFTLATRTDSEIPGPNIKALGRGGSILSLNADIIVVDDIEDANSVAQLGTREKTKEWWFTQLQSRKEEHTGLFVIGSRQHADDLYSQILTEENWDVIVERAHDPACDITDPDGHWDCLLFPEVRSYGWLQGQKLASRNPALFEMVYQNVARTAGLVVFPEGDVKACRNPAYKAGTLPKTGYRLVGGLDPAISGFQASILLAYQTTPELKIWLVDLDNTEGGGVSAAASIIRKWYEQYGLRHWVAERNLLGELTQYQEIQQTIHPHGITVENWRTGHNKNDQYFGVTSLASLFKERQIVLPDADNESKTLTDKLVNQLVVWDEANSRNKNRTGFKDDLVMALWFAWDPIRRARQEFNAEMGVDYGDYPGTAFDSAPWDSPSDPPWAA